MDPQKITNPNLIEKTLVSEILHSLAYLLLAESPNKSKVKDAAERYRGQLMASLDADRRKPFLLTRDIIIELAGMLAGCQDRDELGKLTTYLRSINKGDFMFVAEPKVGMGEDLLDYLKTEFGIDATEKQLNDIINITYALTDHD